MMAVRVKSEFGLYWLAALLLFLATNVWWFERSVRLIPPVRRTLLSSAKAWFPLLSDSRQILELAHWPFWLFAVAAAFLVTGVVRKNVAPRSPLVAAVLIAGLVGSLQPGQLLCGCLVVAAGWLVTKSSSESIAKITLVAIVLTAVSLAITIDFGMVVLVLAGPVLGSLVQCFRAKLLGKRRVWCLLAAVAFAGLTFAPLAFHEGYLAALLRPVNWLWRDTRLIPTMALLNGSALHKVAQMLTATGIVFACFAILKSETATQSTKATAALLTFIGLSCGVYTPLSALALWSMTPPDHGESVRSSRRWMPGLCAALALIPWAVLISQHGVSSMGGGSLPPTVDSSQWKFEGSVLLTNLDQAADWSGANDRQQFDLLLDNRWDVNSNLREEYVQSVDDMVAGLREFYLTGDGSTGGYAMFLRRQQPAVIAIDSTRLGTIRQMSVDPQWRVLAIDSRRTMFGRSDLPVTGPQTEKTGRLCIRLEWPRAGSPPDTAGMLAMGMPSDSRKVAQVLNAMRLPYAALRVLPKDDAWQSRRIKAWCYLELAHRCQRHTGRDSLLDRYRAAVGFRRIKALPFGFGSDRDETQRALRSLDSEEIRAVSLAESSDEIPPQEATVRNALRTGDSAAAEQAIHVLSDESVRRFYETIRLAADTAPPEMLRNFEDLVRSGELTPRLQEEALFDLGCLALELGDVQAAKSWFLASQEANPSSSFSALRAIHLGQLSAGM